MQTCHGLTMVLVVSLHTHQCLDECVRKDLESVWEVLSTFFYPRFSSFESKKKFPTGKHFKNQAFPILKRLLGAIASEQILAALPRLPTKVQLTVQMQNTKDNTSVTVPDRILFAYFDGQYSDYKLGGAADLTHAQKHLLHIARVLVRRELAIVGVGRTMSWE